MSFEFISNTPPETALLLGLTSGALLADTVERIMKHKLRQAADTDKPGGG
jgi:hypothetical protein